MRVDFGLASMRSMVLRTAIIVIIIIIIIIIQTFFFFFFFFFVVVFFLEQFFIIFLVVIVPIAQSFNGFHGIVFGHFECILATGPTGLHGLFPNQQPSFSGIAQSIHRRGGDIGQDNAAMFFTQQTATRTNVHFQASDMVPIGHDPQGRMDIVFGDTLFVRGKQFGHGFHVFGIVQGILDQFHTFVSDLCHFFGIPPELRFQILGKGLCCML